MAAMASRRLLEVVAGAERAAGTGQDRDMLGGIGLEAAEGVGELGGGRRIDGVARRRAVDRDDRHGAVDVMTDCREIRHGTMIVSRADDRQMNWTSRSLNRLHRWAPLP